MMPAPPAFRSLDQRIAVTRRPRRFAVMHQRWEQLLFLHWTVPPETVQATLPPGLFVDTHDGRAYLGVVPFFMRGVRPRFCPPVPGLSNFLVERYLLFSYLERRGLLEVSQVRHAPYPLAGVELDRFSERLFALNGFAEPGRPPDHAIMAGGVAVSIYGLQRAAGPRP